MGRAFERQTNGQVIIIVALLIAMVFVTLAVILNSAIYAENLSTRETADSIEVSGAIAETVHDIDVAMVTVNAEHGDSIEKKNEKFEEIVTYRGDAATTRHATGGAVFSVDLLDTVDGTKLVQNESSKTFENPTGNSDWNLTESADTIRDFQLEVSVEENEEFRIIFGNETDEWKILVEQDENNEYHVTSKENGAAVETCSVEASTEISINLTPGSINGDPCHSLSLENYDWNYIGFQNGDQAEGTYSVLVPNEEYVAENFNEVGQSPFAAPAVYAAELEITYQRSDIYLTRTLVVGHGSEA